MRGKLEGEKRVLDDDWIPLALNCSLSFFSVQEVVLSPSSKSKNKWKTNVFFKSAKLP